MLHAGTGPCEVSKASRPAACCPPNDFLPNNLLPNHFLLSRDVRQVGRQGATWRHAATQLKRLAVAAEVPARWAGARKVVRNQSNRLRQAVNLGRLPRCCSAQRQHTVTCNKALTALQWRLRRSS